MSSFIVLSEGGRASTSKSDGMTWPFLKIGKREAYQHGNRYERHTWVISLNHHATLCYIKTDMQITKIVMGDDDFLKSTCVGPPKYPRAILDTLYLAGKNLC